jgi:putative ABC transport system ATP-binding protein
LLCVLGLLEVSDSGQYWFDGQDISGWSETQLNRLRRGRIGFVFQNFNLLEELTVAENVELALTYSGVSKQERRERAAAMLEQLGIGHRAKHHPSQLSGGQQQRVAIARALVARPAVLLADEPTGNLDTAHGDEVMRLLKQINQEGTTVVMVTHSPEHARQASRTVRLLDGRIQADLPRAA